MAQQRFFFQGGGGTFQQLFSCRFVCNHQGQTPGSFFLFWGAKLLTRKPSPVLVNYSIGGHVPVVTDEGQKEKEGGQDVRSAHNTGNLCNATKNKCQWIRETIWQYALLVYSDDGSSIPLTFCAGQQNLSTSTSYPSCKSSPSPSLFHRIESILSSYTSRKTANPSIHPSRHERKTPTTAPDREREREGRLLPLFLFLFLLFFLPIFVGCCLRIPPHHSDPSSLSFVLPCLYFEAKRWRMTTWLVHLEEMETSACLDVSRRRVVLPLSGKVVWNFISNWGKIETFQITSDWSADVGQNLSRFPWLIIHRRRRSRRRRRLAAYRFGVNGMDGEEGSGQ